MKINIKKLFALLIFICSGFQCTFTYAGPQAWMICMTACELACAASGPGFAACALMCPGHCAAANAFCFHPQTEVIILEDGAEKSKSIKDVRQGDLLKTVAKDQNFWTHVTENVCLNESPQTEFIEITIENPDIDDKTSNIKLRVTPLHGVVLTNNGVYTVDIARNVVVGDKMRHKSGKLVQVTGVDRVDYIGGDCMLKTASATVLANGVLTLAMYDVNYAKDKKMLANGDGIDRWEYSEDWQKALLGMLNK